MSANPRTTIHYVYTLLDANGEVVYVGRSCDVARRLRQHIRTRPAWMLEVRSLTMTGPFDWREACDVERRQIERLQPRGNRMFTKAHGWTSLADTG